MTDQRREALRRLINHHTSVITRSSEAAKQALVREGIYESNGELSPQYGGEERKRLERAS